MSLSPTFQFPADVPERSTALRSSVRLPVTADHPALVRYAPFGDRREIVLRRGPQRMTFQSPASEVGRRSIRIGAHDAVVVAIQQVLSPPVPPSGVPMRSQAELEYHYKPVVDVLYLPDGELLITRTPNGFTDEEVELIVSRIVIEDATSPEPAGTHEPLVAKPGPRAKTSSRVRLGGVVQIGVGLAVWAGSKVLADRTGAYSGRLVFFGTALVSLGLLTVVVPAWVRWVKPPTRPSRQLVVALLLVGVLLVEQRLIQGWLGFN